MKKEKASYKVNIYSVVGNNEVEKKIILLEDRPHINDYVDYFAPKLSTTYAIHFYQLQKDNHYKLIESWFKGKRGWKQAR